MWCRSASARLSVDVEWGEDCFFQGAGCILCDTIDPESQSFSIWIIMHRVTRGYDGGIYWDCGSWSADDSTVRAELANQLTSARAPIKAANSDIK